MNEIIKCKEVVEKMYIGVDVASGKDELVISAPNYPEGILLVRTLLPTRFIFNTVTNYSIDTKLEFSSLGLFDNDDTDTPIIVENK